MKMERYGCTTTDTKVPTTFRKRCQPLFARSAPNKKILNFLRNSSPRQTMDPRAHHRPSSRSSLVPVRPWRPRQTRQTPADFVPSRNASRCTAHRHRRTSSSKCRGTRVHAITRAWPRRCGCFHLVWRRDRHRWSRALRRLGSRNFHRRHHGCRTRLSLSTRTRSALRTHPRSRRSASVTPA